ncbi:MAG: T9SS type A sorting domain-containing protein [Bacteroidia bacterium]
MKKKLHLFSFLLASSLSTFSQQYSQVKSILNTTQDLVNSGNKMLFRTANFSSGGYDLWACDGTNAGTIMIKDFTPGTGVLVPLNRPAWVVKGNNTYFFANDTADAFGLTKKVRLYKSDGTTVGTMSTNYNAAVNSQGNYDGEIFIDTLLNNNVIFIAPDQTGNYQLWKTDGITFTQITSGTYVYNSTTYYADGFNYPTIFNNKLIYFSYASSNGYSTLLGSSDGNSNTYWTSLSVFRAVSQAGFIVFKNKLYFIASANNGTNMASLYVSDGTEAGTSKVTDIYNYGTYNATSSMPLKMVADSNYIYFDGAPTGNPSQLWRTDGTPSGTQKIIDCPGVSKLIVVNNKLYFTGYNTSGYNGLWVSDGTTANTNTIKTYNGGGADNLFNYTDTLFFSDGSGFYKTDGTTAAIKTITLVNPQYSVFNIAKYCIFNGDLYINANSIVTAGTDGGIWKYGAGATGISEESVQSKTIIYPNPATDKFTIESTVEKQTIQIFDLNGRNVLTQNTSGTTTIDASGLKEGVYSVSIKTSNSLINKKLIIVR